MGSNRFSFVFMNVVLLVVLLGLTSLIFDKTGLLFKGELLFLAFLIFISVISMAMIFGDMRIGWTIMYLTMLLALCDATYLYLKDAATGKWLFATLFFSAIGFLVSVMKIRAPKRRLPKPRVVEFENFVASNKGKKYHKEGCDWAKKINPSNKITITEDEAKKKKLKPCYCVTK